jgi:hypothetical protein
MRHSEYTALFRTIAETHVDIQHSPTSMHFARIVIGVNPMLKGVIMEEFLTSMRTKIKFPFMLCVSYDNKYMDKISDNIWKIYPAAFAILDKPKKDDFDDQERVLDETEEIGEEVIGYLKNYFRDVSRRPKYVFDIGEVEMEKLANITKDDLWGVWIDVPFMKTANENLKFKPEKFS